LHFSHDNKFGTTGLSVEGSQQLFKNARLGNHSRDVVSVFGEHRFRFFNKKLDITPGLMMAYYTDFGQQVMPGIDAGFRINDHFKINANWGRTFRLPTYTDLYFFSASINPNPNLKTERATGFELGAKYNSERFSAQIAVFQRDAQRLIDRTRNETTAKWNTNNQNGLLLRGVEIGSNVRLDKAGKYRLDASYFRVLDYDFKKVELLSRYALDFLTDQFNIGLDARLPFGLSASVRCRTNKRQIQVVDYTVVDAKLAWQKNAFSVFAQANNLFNKVYEEQNNIPMPQRWFVMGVDFLFK
jgi:vitamin B12 transporter